MIGRDTMKKYMDIISKEIEDISVEGNNKQGIKTLLKMTSRLYLVKNDFLLDLALNGQPDSDEYEMLTESLMGDEESINKYRKLLGLGPKVFNINS